MSVRAQNEMETQLEARRLKVEWFRIVFGAGASGVHWWMRWDWGQSLGWMREEGQEGREGGERDRQVSPEQRLLDGRDGGMRLQRDRWP